MQNETLTITDNRTNRTYTVPLFKGCVRTMDLRQIKINDDDFGVMGYDPAFMNTASCQSSVTFIDGDRGILRYRGYPIEQLAEIVRREIRLADTEEQIVSLTYRLAQILEVALADLPKAVEAYQEILSIAPQHEDTAR